ncbi:hypothetical protein SprV_0502010300 [Sparganum proliferum]
MVRQLHDGMTARDMDTEAVSQSFAVANGMKQDRVLAPTFSSLMFPPMLMDDFSDEHPGVCIAYRTDGQHLNLRRMHFHLRAFTTTVHELLLADDRAINATTEGDTQSNMDLFAAAGLNVNTEIMAVMHQPPLDAVYRASQINLNGAQLQAVGGFAYLGSTISRCPKINDEVVSQISKAS